MAIIRGNDFSNRLVGYSGSDTIYGYGGDDTLEGRGGNDVLYGGAQDDDLFGGTGINDLYGGSGRDWFIVSPRSGSVSDDLMMDFEFGRDKIDVAAWGISEFNQIQQLLTTDGFGDATFNAVYNGARHVVTLNDVSPSELVASDFIFDVAGPFDVSGTSLADTLFGSRFDDLIEGGSGADWLNGGAGEDEIYGGSGNDRLYGRGSSDELYGNNGNDLLNGGANADDLFGAAGADTLIGDVGADILDGGSGVDLLNGGAGHDDLIGGTGRDTMTGAIGQDAFVFRSTSESRPYAQADRVTDFKPGVDFFDLKDIDARGFASGNQAFDFIGTQTFDGGGQLRYFYSGNDTIIAASTDGDTTPEMQIVLTGRHVLTAGDFIL